MPGSLTQLAANQQRQFDALTSPRTRREQGHFGTAPAIADFMAGMFTEIPHGTVRILDAGAGVGTLSAALCERFLGQPAGRHLVFELWENDPKLRDRLAGTMEGCREVLGPAGHEMEFTIRTDDFVLEHAQSSLFRAAADPTFDLAVMNPPYFKVRKDSDHARVMAHVVHGQPNIYAFFMAVAADLLVDGGEMVAITPRSYFNGPYFKRFRKWFFDRMAARHIHVFDSRIEAFREDQVLQENVILSAKKSGTPSDVVVTSSAGRQLQCVKRYTLPYTGVIEDSSGDHVVRIATGRLEEEIVAAMDRLPQRFRELPFKISTGPVVTFRSIEFLREQRSEDTAPLLWMHNVRPFVTQFPPKNGKPAHLLVSDASKRLLLPAKRYVLLKRFTAKEERRRLVAGIMEAEHSYSPFVGLENHLNYVYRTGGGLSRAEAFGLAALFNSALVDRYFRTISGNTQVNAAEIRAMPVPDIDTIRKIGNLAIRSADRGVELEQAVGEEIGLPAKLIEQLCEASQ
ncbi:MAG TPA: Eco57I restriction-modification methylase domain-containing protein [Pirellulales bacterium]